MERITLDMSFRDYLLSNLGTQLLIDLGWAVLAAIIAVFTFELFGDIAAFLVVLVFLLFWDRRVARYRCSSCHADFSRPELVARRASTPPNTALDAAPRVSMT